MQNSVVKKKKWTKVCPTLAVVHDVRYAIHCPHRGNMKRVLICIECRKLACDLPQSNHRSGFILSNSPSRKVRGTQNKTPSNSPTMTVAELELYFAHLDEGPKQRQSAKSVRCWDLVVRPEPELLSVRLSSNRPPPAKRLLRLRSASRRLCCCCCCCC